MASMIQGFLSEAAADVRARSDPSGSASRFCYMGYYTLGIFAAWLASRARGTARALAAHLDVVMYVSMALALLAARLADVLTQEVRHPRSNRRPSTPPPPARFPLPRGFPRRVRA